MELGRTLVLQPVDQREHEEAMRHAGGEAVPRGALLGHVDLEAVAVSVAKASIIAAVTVTAPVSIRSPGETASNP